MEKYLRNKEESFNADNIKPWLQKEPCELVVEIDIESLNLFEGSKLCRTCK